MQGNLDESLKRILLIKDATSENFFEYKGLKETHYSLHSNKLFKKFKKNCLDYLKFNDLEEKKTEIVLTKLAEKLASEFKSMDFVEKSINTGAFVSVNIKPDIFVKNVSEKYFKNSFSVKDHLRSEEMKEKVILVLFFNVNNITQSDFFSLTFLNYLKRLCTHNNIEVKIQFCKKLFEKRIIDKELTINLEKSIDDLSLSYEIGVDSDFAFYKKNNDIFKDFNFDFDFEIKSHQKDDLTKFFNFVYTSDLIKMYLDGSGCYCDLSNEKLGNLILIKQNVATENFFLLNNLFSIYKRNEFSSEKCYLILENARKQDFFKCKKFMIKIIRSLETDNDEVETKFLNNIQGIFFCKIEGFFNAGLKQLKENLEFARKPILDLINDSDSFQNESTVDLKVTTTNILTYCSIITQFYQKRIDSKINFNWDLQSGIGIYLQYTIARICGIERNTKDIFTSDNFDQELKNINFDLVKNKYNQNENLILEVSLMLHKYSNLVRFSRITNSEVLVLEPHKIIGFLVEFSKKLTSASYNLRVKGEPLDIAKIRLFILIAGKNVLVHGLNLFGIKSVTRM